MVHKDDERSLALLGAEVVMGELLEHDDVIRAAAGTSAAYFCYPVSPGLIPATAYFADAAKRAGLNVVVNMSQISAREDSKSYAARHHWIAERIFDWSGVPTVHLRPTFFSEWLLFPALDYCRKRHHRSAVWQRTPCSNRCGGPGAGYRNHPGKAGRSCREDLSPLRTD
jgi:uncharacterized protein YbjT (DUF2867 family)